MTYTAAHRGLTAPGPGGLQFCRRPQKSWDAWSPLVTVLPPPPDCRPGRSAGLPWIWISMDISMDITLAQHYSIKPMQNSSKLQTTYLLHILMIICFNYLLLCIFITISERNACVMVVLIHGYIHGYSHGYPRKNLWIWMWIWMGNFISTASLNPLPPPSRYATEHNYTDIKNSQLNRPTCRVH